MNKINILFHRSQSLSLLLGLLGVALAGCQQEQAPGAARGAVTAQAGETAARSVSPEVGLDEPVPSPRTLRYGGDVQLAFNGSLYMAAWVERRGDVTHVLATRVTPGGKVLDPGGIYIGEGHYPSIAGAEGTFLVFYRSSARAGNYYDRYLRGALVSNGGERIGDGFDLGPTRHGFEIGFDGTQYQVFWTRDGQGYRARITVDGEVLDPDGMPLAAGNSVRVGPATCAAGSCILVWRQSVGDGDGDGEEIRAAVLDAESGDLRGAGPQVLERNLEQDDDDDAWQLRTYRVVFDGENYVVAWSAGYEEDDDDAAAPGLPPGSDEDPARRRGLRARRISPQGELLEDDIVRMWTWPVEIHAMTHDGSNVLVIGRPWGECENSLVVSRLSPEGVPLDATPHHLADDAGDTAAVAGGHRRTLLVWRDAVAPRNTLHHPVLAGAWLDRSSTALDGPSFPLAITANDQQTPAASFDGQNHLVTWLDHRDNSAGERGGIYGARVTPAGEVLDAQGIEIRATQDPDILSLPRAAFDGHNTVVVWGRQSRSCRYEVAQLEAVRVSPQGEVIDAQPILLPAQTHDDIAIGGASNSVLLGTKSYGDLVHLDRDGNITALPRIYELGNGVHPGELAIASNGTDYLLAIHSRWAAYSQPSIFFLRVSGQGELIDQTLIPIAGSRASSSTTLAATFDGRNYVVAWYDNRSFSRAMRAVRITPAGQVIDHGGIPMAGAGSPCPSQRATAAALAFDGMDSLLVWQGNTGHDQPYTYMGATLSPDGVVSECFPIGDAPEFDYNAPVPFGLAAAGDGSALFVSERYVAGAPLENERVRMRRISQPASP